MTDANETRVAFKTVDLGNLELSDRRQSIRLVSMDVLVSPASSLVRVTYDDLIRHQRKGMQVDLDKQVVLGRPFGVTPSDRLFEQELALRLHGFLSLHE